MRISSFKYLIKINASFHFDFNSAEIDKNMSQAGGWSPRLNKSSTNNLFFGSNDPVPIKSDSSVGGGGGCQFVCCLPA